MTRPKARPAAQTTSPARSRLCPVMPRKDSEERSGRTRFASPPEVGRSEVRSDETVMAWTLPFAASAKRYEKDEARRTLAPRRRLERAHTTDPKRDLASPQIPAIPSPPPGERAG